jgi:hypothetical protein
MIEKKSKEAMDNWINQVKSTLISNDILPENVFESDVELQLLFRSGMTVTECVSMYLPTEDAE